MRQSECAIVLSGLLLLACGDRAPAPAAGDSRTSAPPTGVTLPDLSRSSADVQGLIRGAHDAAAVASIPPEERAARLGELGRLLLAAEYLDAADAALAAAMTLAPDDVRWPHLRGHAARLRHDPSAAARMFERVLDRQRGHLAARLWAAEMRLTLGELDAAAQHLTAARATAPDTAAVADGLGRLALARREYGDAVQHLERAAALAPRATRVRYTLGLAYRGLGDVRRAEANLAHRGGIDVERPDPLFEETLALLQTAAWHELQAGQAIDEGRWDAAVVHFRQAAALAPGNAVTKLNLGHALYQTGDAREAVEQFRAAVQLAPGLAKAHYSLGIVMETEGRDVEALAAYTSAVQADPAYVEARLALAEGLRRMGRPGDALPHYARVTAARPELSQAVFGEAMAHVRLNRHREARARFERGMAMYPEQPGFAHALARLLAAAPEAGVRDGARALTLLEPLVQQQQTAALAETMAMALAERGRFAEAITWQRRAIDLARATGTPTALRTLAGNLARYQRGEACRVPWSPDDPIHSPRAVG